jgi:hypothetical protein
MNKRFILNVALFIAVAMPVGCRGLKKVPSSSFLSGFSLEQLVKNNHSPSGILCARGGMGGSGNRIGSVGAKGFSNAVSSSFSCHPSEADSNSFDEGGFITSLKMDIERQITDSGATINGQGSTDPSGFFIEYAERDIHGRITINGKTSAGGYFSLFANVNEKSENASQPERNITKSLDASGGRAFRIIIGPAMLD